jgi:hypothetical protein
MPTRRPNPLWSLSHQSRIPFRASASATCVARLTSEVAIVPLNTQPAPVFFGHHKAATSWVIKILSDLGHLNGFHVQIYDTAADLSAALPRQSPLRSFLAFRNADPLALGHLEPFLGFHLIRDPRDIAVSSYFSHLHSHPTENWPELKQHKRRLADLDLAEGLLCDMEFCRDLPTRGHNVAPYRCMAEWDYSRPDILEIRYEDLIINPYETLLRIFDFLQLLAPDELGGASLARHLQIIVARRFLPPLFPALPVLRSWNILAAVYDNRYDKKAAGRAPGMADLHNHYRKGIAGDWVNYFEKQHHQRFQELYGDILVRLGYESDSA